MANTWFISATSKQNVKNVSTSKGNTLASRDLNAQTGQQQVTFRSCDSSVNTVTRLRAAQLANHQILGSGAHPVFFGEWATGDFLQWHSGRAVKLVTEPYTIH
jgi:hypothetical protein